MNDQDARGRRDPQLGELLEQAVVLPEPDTALLGGLEPALSGVDRERGAVRQDVGRATRLRRPSFLAAVGFAALLALVAVVNLTGFPGVEQATPPPANAAKLVAVIDAGLTRVNSLQGTFVFDAAPSRGSAQISSVDFATMSNGDKSFDAHYLPDYKELSKGWLSAKNGNIPARFKREEMMLSAAMVRQRVVVDGASGFMQSKTLSVNPVTRQPVALRYRYYRGLVVVGGRVLIAPRDVQQIWLLSSQLRTALAQEQPNVALTDVVYHGRPAYRAVVYGSGGKPLYVAMVDKQYGITLRLSAVPGSHGTDLELTPFHVRDLRVNEPVDPATFVMKPDFTYAPDGYSKRRPTDTPKKYGIDLGERAFPVSELPQRTSSWTVLPTWIPKGYTLQLAVAWPDSSWMWLTYRQGMSDITVATAGKSATGPRGAKTPELSGFVFGATRDGLDIWPAIGSGVSIMPAGAMAGWPAGHGQFPYDNPGLTTVSTATFGISGNVPLDTLERMAESARQARPGPYLPQERYSWQPWLAFAVAAALASAALLLVSRRRRRLADLGISLPLWKSVRLPLIGLVLVVAGASLSWHRLYGAGNDFSVLGWREPLAVVTVAAALLAAAAATWILAAPVKPLVGPRFLTSLLGLLVVAGTALSFVYLPLKARFMLEPFDSGLTWKGLSAVGAYLRGATCPAPGPGLYLALTGACLIMLGGLRLRVGDLSPSQRRRGRFIRLAVFVPLAGGFAWLGLTELSQGRTTLAIVSLVIACLFVVALARTVGMLARARRSSDSAPA